jgi:hypothetical protein
MNREDLRRFPSSQNHTIDALAVANGALLLLRRARRVLDATAFCAFLLRKYMTKQGRDEPRLCPFGLVKGGVPNTMPP